MFLERCNGSFDECGVIANDLNGDSRRQRALELGDADRALAAVATGLRAAPCDEQLYRDRMSAWDVAGNAAAVEAVMAELRMQLEVDSVDDLHPDTVAVYRRCRGVSR